MSGAALSALLVVTACGDDPNSAEKTEQAGEGNEDSAETAPLGGDGFLALACGEDSITVSRFSREDGSVQAEHVFSVADAEATDEPVLAHSRPVESLHSVELPGCSTEAFEDTLSGTFPITSNQAHDLAALVLPDESLLLVTIVEKINGIETTTVGAMSADGGVEALLPADDPSDFSGTTEKISARYSHADGGLYYIEVDHGSETHTVKALDPDSGQVRDVGDCGTRCERLIIDPQSGVLFGTVVVQDTDNPSGPAKISSFYNRHFAFAESGIAGVFQVQDGEISLSEGLEGEPALVPAGRGNNGRPFEGDWEHLKFSRSDSAGQRRPRAVFAVGEYELMLDDNEFTVWSLDPAEEVEEPFFGDPAPVVPRQILPGSDRTNEHPVLSPEGDQLLFRSTDSAGKVSWFTVPAAGGEEPVEIGTAEGEHASMVPIHWS
ncbi:hypothetical protein KGD82_27690 (plasmid) [Nocardiopsis eucommiae]|uniref:Uncharacterized protein n=1 Tax=Nocardiopsis eucommiae TaxID=2831970 RepID=A0A975QL66_9ACTN|nr:hypothetical protein KGD82_27690 [Nocardiopsis eucommiae]